MAPGDPRDRTEDGDRWPSEREGTFTTDPLASPTEEGEEVTDSLGLMCPAASPLVSPRATERDRRGGDAGSVAPGGAEDPRDRLVETDGGTTPIETICAVVSGLTVLCDWGRGDPNSVRSRHWAREESLPGSRVKPSVSAAARASRRSAAKADIHES